MCSNSQNVDDCWAYDRDKYGVIRSDPEAFPNGMKALADYGITHLRSY